MPLDRAKTVQNAEKFFKAGKIPEAISEYKKLAEDNPRDMNVYNKLGDLYLRAGKNQDAIRYFLRIAEFYAADGFFLKAIAMYKKVNKLDPANMDCLQKLAALYLQQGLTIEAKAQYLAVADHFLKTGQVKKVLEVHPKILEIEPDNIKIRMAYADLLMRSGTLVEACRHYRHVAQDLAKKGMFDEAIKVAQKGAKAAPGDPDMMSLVLALTKEAEKSPGDLLATVVQMARANGDNPRSLALLGEAYLCAGKTADAEKVFRKLQDVAEGAPPEVAAAVGRFHISKGEADAALEWMSRATDGFLEGARQDDAAGLLDEFLRAFPDHQAGLAKRAAVAERAGDGKGQVEALQRLAAILIQTSESVAAREIVERLQALEPDNPRHAEMLRQLEGQGGVAAAPAAPPRSAAEPTTSVARFQGAPEAIDLEGEPVAEEALGEEIAVDEEGADESAEPAAGGDALGDLGEEAYGPGSKIQEIQAGADSAEEEDDDFISEHFTEAEVFVKYGLLEKAKEQLLKILAKHPRHVASHTKLKEIHYDEGDKEKAVEECLTLANIMKERGRREEAQDLVNEAIRIDPNNPRVRQYAAAPTASTPASASQASTVRPTVAAAPQTSPAKPARASRPAQAPPRELEIEPVIEEETTTPAPAIQPVEVAPAGDVEIEIEMPEEAPARTPPPAPAPAAKSTGPKPRPQKVEEETPEDFLSGLSLGEDGEEIAIEMGEESTSVPASMAIAASSDPDPEKLGEVDFYIDQGLLEEARAVLFQLQKQYPGSQEVAQRFERANRPAQETPPPVATTPRSEEGAGLDVDVERAFGSQTISMPAPPPPAPAPRASRPKPVFKVETAEPEPEGDFFDLASELDKSLAEAQVAVEAQEQEALEGPGHSLEEIFKAFKRGVEQQVDSQDYDTHYNLGIAYKEMGLVDEAIGEFQFAAKDPARTIECCGILGLCFREKGMPQLALKWFHKGLDMPGIGEREAMGLRYDVAEVYREQGDYKKAMQIYTEVYGMDSNYRDVAGKIKEVKRLLG
jgi:tetratricopeptide (TPR) repeat protein